jgi:hypothetical protein
VKAERNLIPAWISITVTAGLFLGNQGIGLRAQWIGLEHILGY